MMTIIHSFRRGRFLLVALVVTLLAGMGANVTADDEFQEALQQTEDEFNAVRQTMQQAKTKFDDFQKKYQEYEDAVFSQDAERGIQLAKQLFKLDDSQTAEAKKKLSQLREMFNEIDRAGLKTKLKTASEYLEKADGIAGEVSNAWDFAKKFNPENAKDNPTYGLRLIGDILTESAGKLEKIPLIGQILGPWVKAYGEVTGDFANALDRLGKKIADFRGGALCGQTGYKTDQQAAFEAASSSETCLQYFPYGGFPRLRGETYVGNSKYFLYDPSSKRGYFADVGVTDKVYAWHALLLERRALDPDWLASRANSLTAEVENRARSCARLLIGWHTKSDNGWQIIDELGLTDDVYFYGRLDEETIVANYIIVESHHDAIEAIMEQFEKYVLVSGTVSEEVDGQVSRSSGATVEFRVNGRTFSQTTEDDGRFEILIEAQPGDAIDERVSKEGFETKTSSGRLPERVVNGMAYTLYKEETRVTITGTATIDPGGDGASHPADGATISASAPSGELGSATTGGDGTYTLTAVVPNGVSVTLSAVKGDTTGSTSVTVSSEAHSGADISMTPGEQAPDTAKWTINVKVLDGDGKPVGQATVTGGPGAVTTGDDGAAIVGPIPVTEEPFSVTLSASVLTEDGVRISGAAATVNYEGNQTSEVTLSIPVETPVEVTISGRVNDANGVGLDGATVTGGQLSATSGGGGAFTLGPILMTKGQSLEVSASFSDGTNSYASQAQSVVYDGTSKTLSATLVIEVETFLDVTIGGRVVDLNGQPLPSAAVSCAGVSATSDASGGYTLPPVNCKLGTPINVSASFTTDDGTVVAGQTSVSPTTDKATAPNIVLDVVQEEVLQVTVSGSVTTTDGQGVGGATVTVGGVSGATDPSGAYSIGPVELVSGQAVPVAATATKDDGSAVAGQVTITPQADAVAAPNIVLDFESDGVAQVTISGRVMSTDGAGIGGATVMGGGQSASTDGSGSFTLPAFEHKLGESVTISASTVGDDGSTVSSSAAVTPTSTQATASITIDVGATGEGDDDDIDDLIDDLDDDVEGLDPTALMAEYRVLLADMDGVAADFDHQANHFEQRVREIGSGICEAGDVSHAMYAAEQNLSTYSSLMVALFGVYADLVTVQAADATAVDLGEVDAAFDRVTERESTMESRLAGLHGTYASYECDKESSEVDEEGDAEGDADPDDVEGGADGGGGVEVCDDGIDNDGDNEIDECDAGCCDKNVQITVTDCGTAADDIFLVAVDGGDVGVTPKGAANTFNVELSPGDHTITITCLDDGGEPGVADDIGTVCVTAIAYNQDATVSGGIGGGEGHIDLGGSENFSIYVPSGPVSSSPAPRFDGSTLPPEGGNR